MNLTTEQLEWIRRQVDQAPPLSDEQRTKLAELLAPVRVSGGESCVT